ncbi:hypothetical protein FQJ88_14700 [Xanthomonas vasicola]|uniref:Uncharacterized protein n=1 Tax=Xanthomonas vasicola TaxID=56459 RepID=A0ABD7S3I8_XANVA|nr:hypothetical protein [Xanthomonas vasicola]TWQ30049.1 hypothetical protein FQJ97_23010 [Xanthomonas vasicola]TWQ44027.1 hypothetical protein FQK01_24955 [Xanthomonas vasicola]TWQ54710.1 hypothetical protein FQJ94_11840 [Xanthomonas vasicola]TWQ73214.1 hypothetical protein FQJ92_07300 [Xanthomonas vasicola]TWQ93252.1 hypothetical protein FQJ88_14700 [Xanthomonas vasicola]
MIDALTMCAMQVDATETFHERRGTTRIQSWNDIAGPDRHPLLRILQCRASINDSAADRSMSYLDKQPGDIDQELKRFSPPIRSF